MQVNLAYFAKDVEPRQHYRSRHRVKEKIPLDTQGFQIKTEQDVSNDIGMNVEEQTIDADPITCKERKQGYKDDPQSHQFDRKSS